jgi:tetratricopeptide (TPR) repeat protein
VPCPRCSFVGALALNDPAVSRTPAIEGYELIHEIGRGAMGVVWVARDCTLDRLVALKLIATGSNPLLAQRLLREGQAAARLRHPHIVAVHALGGSGSSTFLAMDFLTGGNLEARLREKPLAPRAAAEMLATLAAALAHAHAAGLLHRDIKPSNILLDGDGKPHLADFGLAAPLEGAGELTATGQIAGTPAYLAPELLATADRATPQCDLYGLGAVLYACLTGRPPFVGESTAAILKQLAETEPLAPRLLQPGVPRDLDTICLKCLEKNPARRYASAVALQHDLERFLRGEPIVARPVGSLGRATRWCRRHPGAAVSIGLAAAILVLLGVGGPLVALRLDRARRAAEAEHAHAATETATRKEIIDFLEKDLLAQASPSNQPDRDLKLRTVLDRAAKKIENRFADRPLVEASIRSTLGKTYLSLGEFASARHHFERARALRTQLLGPEDAQTLDLLSDLTLVLIGEGKYRDAEALGIATLSAQQRTLGRENAETLASMLNLEMVYQHEGKIAEAQKLLDDTLATARRALGRDHPTTLTAMSDLAFLQRTKRNLAESETLNAQTLAARQRVLGPEHQDTLSSMTNLAAVYRLEGKLAEAEALFTQVLDISKRVMGTEHPETLSAMNNLAVAHQERGKFSDAGTLLMQILEISKRVSGPEHPNTLRSMSNLAVVYQTIGRFADAEALGGEMLGICRRVLGPTHPTTLIAMNNLATVYRLENKLTEAEQLSVDALTLIRQTLGPEHADTWRFMQNLALIYQNEGKIHEAETLCRQTLETRRRVLGAANPETLQSADTLGDVLLRARRYAEAEPLLRESLEGRTKLAPNHWSTAATRSHLGEALAGLKRYAEAEPLLLASYETLKAQADAIPASSRPIVRRACARVVQLYSDSQQERKAAEWRQKLSGLTTQ